MKSLRIAKAAGSIWRRKEMSARMDESPPATPKASVQSTQSLHSMGHPQCPGLQRGTG